MPARHSKARSKGRPEAGSEGGFTLLELLAALTVLAVLMTMMFGGLRFGARVWETGDRGLRGLAELQTASGFIRRQIAQAVPADPGSGGQVTIGEGETRYNVNVDWLTGRVSVGEAGDG